MSPAGKAISVAMDTPEDWDIGEYIIHHKPSGTTLWIGNGPLTFDGYNGTPPILGMLERFTLWWKYKRMANVAVANRLARPALNEQTGSGHE